MCGIVGYIGEQDATSILLNGLKRLEYRGYDSAGVAVVNGGLTVKKRVGKVSVLDRVLQTEPVSGTVGIGHTRWATHGAPNDLNAHPHTDEDGEIALIHNGIIENYAALKKKLAADGYTFRSETDTEVLVVLIRAFYDELGDMAKAFRYALKQVVGAYGIAMVSAFDPNRLYVARNGSPLAIGIGDGEFIVASDASAIVQHTRQVVYLDDGEMAVIERDRYVTKRIDDDTTVDKEVEEVEFDLAEIEKGGYDHFMLKEIFEIRQNWRKGYYDKATVENSQP